MDGAPLDRCTRFQPGVMCAQRRAAARDGSIYYSSHYGGWIFPADDRKVPQLLREEHKAPMVWTFCPFCQGALPDEASAVERMLRQPVRDEPSDRGGGEGSEV